MVLILLTIYAIRKYNQRKKEKAAMEANMGNLADFSSAPLAPYSTQQKLRPVSGGLVPTSELACATPRRGRCHNKRNRGYCGPKNTHQVYTCKHQRQCANNCSHGPSAPIEKCPYQQKCRRKCAQQNHQHSKGLALADAEAAALGNGWNHNKKIAFELTDEQAREFDEAYGSDEEGDHWEQKPELEAVPSAAPPAYTYSDRALLSTI